MKDIHDFESIGDILKRKAIIWKEEDTETEKDLLIDEAAQPTLCRPVSQ